MLLQMEGKKTRMVKHATPILIEFKTKLGTDVFLQRCVEILAEQAMAKNGIEEQKLDVSRANFETRVTRIFSVLEPPAKKIDKSKDFRAFMKTQKLEATGTSMQ